MAQAVSYTQFYGSSVALVTPMDNHGNIDFDALEELIEWHISNGTNSIVSMGTTGESALVTDEEFISVIKRTQVIVGKRIPVIAGCASPSTNKSIAICQKLNEIELDAVLCVTPYYVKPTQIGLQEYFSQLADESRAPIILYNVPSRTGVDLGDDSILKLSQHRNIVGIKDATGDIDRASRLIPQIEQFVFLSGDDETAFDFVQAGGKGVISVTANITPYEMSRWIGLSLNDLESEEAKQIFESLMPLHEALFVEPNPIPVKWALTILGQLQEGIRSPLTNPSSVSKDIIRLALKKCQLLN
ncbi:MAG: 4-hydroxy-tetrahydrodipicolinate synthase [Kangiellaceae bacterium]|nr:4-hydroxy-tetrahydrodipicolinate synthase [Kangiellaceae bacterium]MCW9000721.1 4-hydroxy-tetrahydrodipicolinate synthase [Kangiellaceae bacterium]MCW9017352.1 4-hydroxy-tetrahydrodipicolinate synthase [Kangiellaceae bacterium]